MTIARLSQGNQKHYHCLARSLLYFVRFLLMMIGIPDRSEPIFH